MRPNATRNFPWSESRSALPAADTGPVEFVRVLLAAFGHQVEKTLLGQPFSLAPGIVSVGPDEPTQQDGRAVIFFRGSSIFDSRIHEGKPKCDTPVTDFAGRFWYL